MKKCSKCGFENNDENQFCGKCGSALCDNNSEVTACKGCGKEYDASLKFCPFCGLKSTENKKTKKLRIIIFSVMLCALIAAVIFIIPKGTSTNSITATQPAIETETSATETVTLLTEPEIIEIDPYDFCSISYGGYSGHGEAFFSIDKSDFSYLLDSTEYSRLSNSDKLKLQKVVEDMNGKIITKNISNGSTVTVNLNYDKAALEEMGVAFSSNSLKYTASGLTEMIKINPFEDTILRTSGLSGKVTIENVDYSASPYAWLLDEYTSITYSTLSGNQSGYLCGGDIVTIKFVYDKETLGAMGYELTQDSGDFTITCREPLTYDTLMWCDKSELKAAFDREAQTLLESPTVRKYVTSITPYAYVYFPSVPERYIYTTNHPENYLDCNAVAIYSSTNGRGGESYLAVLFDEVWYKSNGEFEYTLKSNNGFGYDGFVQADSVKWIAGDISAEKMAEIWSRYFESVRAGWTLMEDASTGRMEKKSNVFLITPDDDYNLIPSFDLLFGDNVDRALCRVAEYLKASDAFLEFNPECENMSLDEIAQNLREGKYYDECYFSGDYLYITAYGEYHPIEYAVISKYDLASYFSKINVAAYDDRSR